MGAWFSKRDQFKSPAQLQEELEQIDVQMAALEAREAALERQRRRLVLLVLSIAVLVVLVLVVRWYWFYYPPLVDSWTSYSLLAKPNFVVVVL
jgi:type VI protein secretion system component VasF